MAKNCNKKSTKKLLNKKILKSGKMKNPKKMAK